MAPTKFTVFPKLPPELRNKVWYHAANQEGRIIDIWTDFKRCEIENTTFYTQSYECELSTRPPPPIFRVCTESRNEALKHYDLEFATSMTLPGGIAVNIPARMYINYASDTLVPRGYWNIVSFYNFTGRLSGKLRSLAIDVNGTFWTENMKDYCKKRYWLFGELEELILYDSSEEEIFKDSAFLEKFRQRYRGGPKDLGFSDLSFGDPEKMNWMEDLTQQLTDVKMFMEKMFDKIEGKLVDVVVYDDDGVPIETELEVHPGYMKGYDATTAEELNRPVLKLARLEIKEPTVVPI